MNTSGNPEWYNESGDGVVGVQHAKEASEEDETDDSWNVMDGIWK
jgi:hypothetical protein